MTPAQKKRFMTYYEQFVHSVFTFFYYRIGRDRALAEDLTSETFLKAIRAFDSFDQSRNFKAWLFTIAQRHMIDYFRAKKPIISVDDIDPIPTPSFEKNIAAKMEIERILSHLDSLSENDRELIILRYVNDIEPQEIAGILGKNPGAVRVALHRALQALKEACTISETPPP